MSRRPLALFVTLVASTAIGCGSADDHGLFGDNSGAQEAGPPADASGGQPDASQGEASAGDDVTAPDTSTGPEGATPDAEPLPDGGCQEGQTKQYPCGINGRGTQTDVCMNGLWTAGACVDPDVCFDGDAQQVPCGPGGSGKLEQDCVGGQWKDAGECVLPPPPQGHWECANGACVPVVDNLLCGDGYCSPADGESPESCPKDCGALAGQNGQNKPCEGGLDCAFYAWPGSGTGYWECKWSSGQDYCNAVQTGSYCGATGYDYCYYGSMGIETPASCPKDCANKTLNDEGQNGCGDPSDCIFLHWPGSLP